MNLLVTPAEATDFFSRIPWFFKVSLGLMVLRGLFWLVNQMPKENKSLQKRSRAPAASASPSSQGTAVLFDPATAEHVLVLKDGQQLGPFSFEGINNKIWPCAFEPSDLAWHEGLADWQPLT